MAERPEAPSGTASAAPLAFALGAVALWATNALVGKTLLANHPVSQVQFLQFCGAALVFALIRLAGGAAPTALPWPAGLAATLGPFAVGFIGLVGTMVLQYLAFASVPVIEANLVAYTWPLMVAAAVIVLGRPRRPLLLGLAAALGFVGVALVISGGRAHAWSGGSLAGYAAAFGSAMCMALYSIAVGRLAVSPDRLLLPSALIGVALTFAWSLYVGASVPAGTDLLLGLYLGAGPMGLGYYFWSRALKLDQGGRLAVVAYLTPIASTLLLALSGESLSMTAIAGAVLVIGSCIAVGIERSEA
ncbi:DMT family transporter [Mesorhizobium sp. B1-1-8]|uniref:DMT family transporter n=1 Tax=Mesorhizobium sp. B1-1-8 TaxID=2589976 RepID=UPI00112790E3|nr:DMT family transporter [Mesorhizobium sp. B1-1-8]UCI06561.1 DMT family transporter [Mesorhizobium sp. B1-1-8]